MSLSPSQASYIEEVIKNCLRGKFKNYKPETSYMPFHFRLLGKDRMALYSFIHSLNTSFGTSIFEPVAVALAKQKFKDAKRKVLVGDKISEEAHRIIQNIMNDLTTAQKQPDKESEIQSIREVCRTGNMNKVRPSQADLCVEDHNGTIFLFDLKTAKPNIGNFKDFKRTLLEWVAATLADNPQKRVKTAIAIPYNPYEPLPYERWTLRGMIDLSEELFVANEFWDFLGGENSYEELLSCFERAGIELRPEIESYFSKFK